MGFFVWEENGEIFMSQIQVTALTYGYEGSFDTVFENVSFGIDTDWKLGLIGRNGKGKTTFLNLLRGKWFSADRWADKSFSYHKERLISCRELSVRYESAGEDVLNNLTFELVQGDIRTFCQERNLEESLFFALLRQLDMERAQFAKRLEEFSEGQKKKVLIAASLMTPAHVYIWDEPLNYIDVFSGMQIEQLILRYQPTMILVDHDIRFQEKIATRVVEL